jgi:hypothetical protein
MNGVWRTLGTVLLVLAAARSVSAQPSPPSEVGSVCVLPHVKRADARTQSPDVPPAAREYSLRLDGGQWVSLSSQERVLLTGIPRAGRHKVAIRGDGRPFVAFTFTFRGFRAPQLCLLQSDMYLTWQLYASRDSFAACRCDGVEPVTWKPGPRGGR